MFGYVRKTALTVLLAAALCGCTTDDLAKVAGSSEPLAIRSVTVEGVAPTSVSQGVDARLRASVSGLAARPGARPGRMTVTISGYSGRGDAAIYRAEASVAVQLKAEAGGRIVKSETFRQETSASGQAEAERRIADDIAARVGRSFDFAPPPAEQPKPRSQDARPSPRRTPVGVSTRPTLSSDTLETLQQAAGSTGATPDETRTSTVPLAAESGCKGSDGEVCANASPLSGDLGLRK